MKRKYSISYFILLAAVAMAFLFAYLTTSPYSEVETDLVDKGEMRIPEYVDGDVSSEVVPESTQNMQDPPPTTGYILYSDGSYVVVYLYDNVTIFERTEISIDLLPVPIQEELKSGKYIETTEELYGFLENYSS